MQTEQPTLITSVTSAAALMKNYFIGFDGNVCAAAAKALGVCHADTAITLQAPVVAEGIVLVYSGAAIAAVGTSVEADSTGRAVTKASGVINGYNLDIATAADELIRILLK